MTITQSIQGEVVKTTYLVYLHHTKNEAYSVPQQVAQRDPEAHARALPNGVFAFHYYDVYTSMVDDNGVQVELTSKRLNGDKVYFVDAKVFTPAELEAHPSGSGALQSMKGHGDAKAMVLTRVGGFEFWNLDLSKNEIILTR